MNLIEFEEAFKGIGLKHKIDINCSDCGGPRNIYKEKARDTILLKGRYVCRSCSMKISHAENPYSDERRTKISQSMTGVSKSAEAKQKMSDSKKAFFQTPAGELFKQKLSRLAAQGHAENKFENARRKGWYFSEKNQKEIFYSSSYELRLIVELDSDDTVTSYETQIQYSCGARSRCLDCLVTYNDDSKLAIEVKPKTRLNEQENIEQINDSRNNANLNGWRFEVYTEDNFGMTETEIRNWADEFRTKEGPFDWVSFRKERNKLKAKKHYDSKIATDTVEVWCDYCKENHTPLRLTYEKNIARNGKYICEKHGGHLSGSKPRKKKASPYGEGMKKCTGPCGRVLPIDNFSAGKAKCKECRANSYKQKYRDKGV